MNGHKPNGPEHHVDQTAAPIGPATADGEPSVIGSGSTNQNSEPMEERVGYGRPPKASQFKPGQSGNPGGRPKGKPDVRREIEDVLSELVLVNFGGEERRMSLVAAGSQS